MYDFNVLENAEWFSIFVRVITYNRLKMKNERKTERWKEKKTQRKRWPFPHSNQIFVIVIVVIGIILVCLFFGIENNNKESP